ncbi:toprim domain-containing protein, partial [Pandoraea sputorum]|uniref:toprim domain-containing protein n=1 Tax=Pandoraea sputorum TaxID=93222 RepID=UPI003556BDD2
MFLCEKPSQAKDIARVLGANARGDGCLTGNGICVTWCIGHLLETAPPHAYDPRYKAWALEHLPIISDAWKVEVKTKTASQFKAVKKLLAQASELVIATDADREGELIAREIMDFCGYHGLVQRLCPTGVGKTWLACTLAHKACRDGYSVRYLRLPRL